MSRDRDPIVAGQFYASRHDQWLATARACMHGATRREKLTKLVMVPHAGHVFSGGVAGQTLAQAHLTDTVLLLGPNHTGMGAPLAVWPDGNALCIPPGIPPDIPPVIPPVIPPAAGWLCVWPREPVTKPPPTPKPPPLPCVWPDGCC